MAQIDYTIGGKLRGFSDYQRANEEFQLKKQLQQAQIDKAMMPEQITPYQAASLELQKQRLALQGGGGAYLDENGEIVTMPALGKPLPSSLSKGVLENRQNLSKAQSALDLVQGKNVQMGGESIGGDKDATGWKGYLPNAILNRVDPVGVPTRAAIADLGSMVIHDRSGAAVSASEFPRLAPFIPSEKDDAKTVETKLRNFTATYKQLVEDGELFHKESGYKVPAGNLSTSGVQPPAGALPQGWTVRVK